LKTVKSSFTNQKLTPLDIAKKSGFASLYDILTPHIYHIIPANYLTTVEEQFHKLIEENSSTNNDNAEVIRGVHDSFQLPQLSLLTEIKDPEMWFPISCGTHKKVSLFPRFELRKLTASKGVPFPFSRLRIGCLKYWDS
jgi:hypothetical protein